MLRKRLTGQHSMKYRDSDISKVLLPLINTGKDYIITAEAPDFADVKDKDVVKGLLIARNSVGAAMRASFHIYSVYEDTIVSHKMIQSYPWKRNRVTRSQHLHFVWGHFTNLCYLFEERYKSFVQMQHQMQSTFRKQRTIAIRDGIKEIRTALGAHIRQRGQNTHEWSTSNPHAESFRTIEFINLHHPQAGPLGNVTGHYRVTRMLMRWEIETALHFMEDFLLLAFRKQIPEIAECATLFNEIVRAATAGHVSMQGNQMNVNLRT